MRVIAGTVGGRKLLAPKGTRVRPTSDRVKEALFSILLSRLGNISSLKILDLFAGTGNLGIEALSRGADQIVFVDSSPESASIIRSNLILAGFADKAEVICADAVRSLKQLQQRRVHFDIVFLDPPYRETALLQAALKEIASQTILSPGGIVVIETNKGNSPLHPDELTILDRRIYGDTAIIILGASI